MNKTQRIIIVTGCILAAANFLFMPADQMSGGEWKLSPVTLSVLDTESYASLRLNSGQLCLRLGAVALITGALAFAFRSKSAPSS